MPVPFDDNTCVAEPTPPIATIDLTDIAVELMVVFTAEFPTVMSENTDSDVRLLPVSNMFVPSDENNLRSVRFIANSPILNVDVFGDLPATEDRRNLNVVFANFGPFLHQYILTGNLPFRMYQNP